MLLCLLVASESSKLTNNFFYIALLPAALVLTYKRALKPNGTFIILMCYLLYVSLSTFWSNSDLETSLKQLKYVIYVAAFIGIAHYVSRSIKRISLLSATILVLAFALEIQSLYTQISTIGLDSWLDSFPRLSDTTGPLNAIFLALVIGLFGFILIALHIQNPWVATILIFTLIILTLPLQSRTVIIALTVAHTYFLFRKKEFLALSIWAVGCILASLMIFMGVERFSSSLYRDDIWLYTIKAWSDNCSVLFGCGNRYNFNIEIQGHYFYHPHSILLSQLLYGGIAGLFLMAIFAYTILKKISNTDPIWLAVLAFSASASATIGHTILTHPDFIWVLIWLPLSLSGALFESQHSTQLHPKNN